MSKSVRQVCKSCQKIKTLHAFKEGRNGECSYCYLNNDPNKPRNEKVPCKCLKCDSIYFSDFKFGICSLCKQKDDYKNFAFEQSHRVGL